MSSKLLKNGIWLFILQVFNTVVPMLTLPYITRILEPSGYGEFSLALNWVLYFQVIVEYGFGYWGVRKVATDNGRTLQKTFNNIITARLLLLILSFFLMTIVFLLSGKGLDHFVCMSILFSMVLGVAFQLTWLFQGMQEMKYITLINAISRLASVLLIFLMVKRATDVNLYAFLYSATYIISAIMGLYLAHKRYGLKFGVICLKEAIGALREAWPLFISQAMAKILSGFGVTVLGMVAVSSAVGIYSAIYKIPYAMALFFNPISQAIYPNISTEFNKSVGNGFRRIKKIATLVMPFFFIISIATMYFHRQIVQICFGSEYSNYSNILVPLCLWFLFSIINNFLGIQILVASGHQQEYSKAFFISTLAAIVMYIILGNLFNIYGIAIATFFAEITLTVILFIQIKRIWRNVDNA